MNELEMPALIDKLINDDKSVLILDTCSLLDIVRVPFREAIQPLTAGQQILNNIAASKFNIVLPSLIIEEWNNNISNVCDEAKNFIEKSQKKLKFLYQTATKLNVILNPPPDFSSFNLEIMLRSLSKEIINSSLILKTQSEEYHLKALKRVFANTPPSKKGKDSVKDCIIYEETLDIGSKLRSVGFTKEIIFASSNTIEYKNDYIIDELSEIGMKYADNLHLAFHLVKS